MPVACEHDVGGFQVAKNNGRLAQMQVLQHRAELYANSEYFFDWQLSPYFVQVVFQRLALDVVHHQVVAARIAKLLVDARQVGMCQARQQVGLAFEGQGGLDKFLWAQAILAHLLDGQQSIAKLDVRRLIDGSKAPVAYATEDAIALLEDVLLDKQPGQGVAGAAMSGFVQRASTGRAKHRLRSIGRATRITKEG